MVLWLTCSAVHSIALCLLLPCNTPGNSRGPTIREGKTFLVLLVAPYTRGNFCSLQASTSHGSRSQCAPAPWKEIRPGPGEFRVVVGVAYFLRGPTDREGKTFLFLILAPYTVGNFCSLH